MRYSRPVSPGSISRYNLPAGNDGSYHTAQQIARLIKEGTSDWNLRQFVVGEMLYGVPEKDYLAEIHAIHNWIQMNLVYRKDPVGIDLVIGAPKILEMVMNGISGFDCDDMVVFEGTCLRIAGIPVDLIIIKANHRVPDSWSHIYLIAYDLKTGTAVPLDPIMKGDKYPVGWEAPFNFGRKIIPLDGLAGNFGLGMYEYQRVTAGTPFQTNISGSTSRDIFNSYLNEKRKFVDYIFKINRAFDKDYSAIISDTSKNDLQKASMMNAMGIRQDNTIKNIKSQSEPQEPAGITSDLKIEALEIQNAKLRDYLLDIQEIKRIAGLFNQIGNAYINKIQVESIKLQKRAAARARTQFIQKVFRDLGAIALNFIPAVGSAAGFVGSLGNQFYELDEKIRNEKWLTSAIKAVEQSMGPGDAEVYLLGKSDDIQSKLSNIEEIVNLKIQLNNSRLNQLKALPSGSVQQVATPTKISVPVKAAIGVSAAALLWVLL